VAGWSHPRTSRRGAFRFAPIQSSRGKAGRFYGATPCVALLASHSAQGQPWLYRGKEGCCVDARDRVQAGIVVAAVATTGTAVAVWLLAPDQRREAAHHSDPRDAHWRITRTRIERCAIPACSSTLTKRLLVGGMWLMGDHPLVDLSAAELRTFGHIVLSSLSELTTWAFHSEIGEQHLRGKRDELNTASAAARMSAGASPP